MSMQRNGKKFFFLKRVTDIDHITTIIQSLEQYTFTAATYPDPAI